MSKGTLVDLAKCIGCRGCQVSCKEWNQLPVVKTTCQGTYENPIKHDDRTFAKIRFIEGEHDQNFFWKFVSKQCMHCLEPACVSACLVKALEKTAQGPVIYHEDLCIGCRYCMLACPFDVPKFEYSKLLPRIRKCTHCFDRQQEGMMPACNKTCPTGALRFGERQELLDVAKSRIYGEPDRYVHHIYGEHEAGGTGWLYISDIPFEKLGLRTDISVTPYPAFTKAFLTTVPLVLMGGAGLLTGLHWFVKRREEISKAEADKIQQEV
ncbi:4Fe-4S dicluster domain-containing protein [Thermodesulfobacteriota bacterium]